MPLLNPGDPFPRLTIETAGGESLTIPDAFAGDFAAVLFYRGAWCPYDGSSRVCGQGQPHPVRDCSGRRAAGDRAPGCGAAGQVPAGR